MKIMKTAAAQQVRKSSGVGRKHTGIEEGMGPQLPSL